MVAAPIALLFWGIPWFHSGPSAQDKAQDALVLEWKDVQGNRDGIWGNENLPAGTRGPGFDLDAPSSKDLDAFRAWRAQQLAARGVSSIGTTGDEVIEGQALLEMARYGRPASAYTDGRVQADGHSIYWQRWDAVGEQDAVTVIVPGYTESTADWIHVANRLNAAGSRVYMFDPPGQGASDGRRGDADSPQEWKSAYEALLAKAQAENPGAKIVVMAHSTGGGVVADVEHDRQLGQVHGRAPDGLVLSAPYLDMRPTIQNRIAETLAKIPFANRLQVPPLIKLSDDALGAQRMKEWQEATGAKQTLHFIATMEEMTARHEAWLKSGGGLGVPMEIVQSKDDPVTDPAKSRQLVAQSSNATFRSVDSGSHDLEYDARGIAALTQAWSDVAQRAGANVGRAAATTPSGGEPVPAGIGSTANTGFKH